MQTCPACSQENPDGFRLCGMCGASLAVAPVEAREERKVVTVLFTDLVGFTSKAEQLDPEDVRATLSPYYARLRAEIEHHGGTVEKFIGDAVMAVFGAPVAHEDDPERAVRAALAIREAVADDLQIRTAVNTGEALVSLGARPNEGEGMVSGDVVNTAARLQSAAPVNGILVGEATYRATRDRIEYREAPAVEAKGKAQPVPVWEVVGARASFGSDVEEHLRTPLVGRLRERSLLADALARARSEQSVQLVTLVGVPGIGKSRLVAELFQIVEDDPDLIYWRQGRSLPYGESVSFWALGEIVKAHAGILESDSAGDAEQKLDALLESLGDDEQERSWLAAHARPLVGLEGEERADRNEAFAAWRRLFEASAEQRPLVLVFEDLHWADDGMLDFVDHLADWATTAPLLIVGTARPELLDRRPGWGGGKRNAFTVSIGALSDDETAQLLRFLFGRTVLPAELQQAVLRRAEGNPLYAEEYVRMLQDQGEAGALALPESVQGVIAARLDALPAAEKALLQDAAVIGKVFWPGAVGNPDARLLHALERKEFVRRDRRSSIGGETQYAFLHALVRDVAYGQIPRAQRVERHRRAAEWIAALSSDRNDDRAEMQAHHYREALALAAAAGVAAADLREPAKRAFADAAERALALHGWGVTRDLAHEALALMEPDDPLRPHVLLRLADAASKLDDFDLEPALEARDAFLAQGDPENAARVEILLSWMTFWRGDSNEGREHSRRAVELLAGGPPSALQALALARHARRTLLAGAPEEGISLARRALELAEQFDDERIASDALNTLGVALSELGDESGVVRLRESIARAESANSPLDITVGWNNLMNCLWRWGRLAEADECFQAFAAASTRFGIASSLRWLEAEAVQGHGLRGELREALAGAEAVLAGFGGKPRYEAAAMHSWRGIVLATRGRHEEALAASREGLDQARAVGDPQGLWPTEAQHAFVLAATGRRDDALAALERITAHGGFLAFPDATASLPLLAVELDRPELYTAAAAGRLPTIWHEAAAAATSGDLVHAADVYDRIGARFHAAWCRLLAAERGDTSQLEAALGYFVAEEATAFVRRCEAALPASA